MAKRAITVSAAALLCNCLDAALWLGQRRAKQSSTRDREIDKMIGWGAG